jgi:restriction system protein
LKGKKMWMVRCDGGQLAETFLEQGMISIGWHEVGSLAGVKSREQVIEKVRVTWPEFKRMKVVVADSQLHKVSSLIKTGDRVMTYDPSKRIYHVGCLARGYQATFSQEDDRDAQKIVMIWLRILRKKMVRKVRFVCAKSR